MEPLTFKASRFEFKAHRDEAGVPHIEAASWLEALYALGYLHALDRPTQIHFARTVAAGRSAERFANRPELVEMDRLLRRAGIHRRLSEEVGMLPQRLRDQLDWYCRGVNDGLSEVGRTLPMWATGYQPLPWDPEGVLLIGNLLSFAGLAVGEQETKRVMLELIQLGIDDDRLRELFSPYLDGVDFEPLRRVNLAKKLSDDALEILADLPRLAGSNAWAVAPERSATGGALLASDPHLEVNRLPAIWYEAVLRWRTSEDGPEEYAMGATLPGCPLMAVGRTPRLAWGVTYMHASTSDYFIEELRIAEGHETENQDPDDTNPKPDDAEPVDAEPDEEAETVGPIRWQYRRGEEWIDYKPRTERINRKGDEPVEEIVYENEVGTLTLEPNEPGEYISVAWVGSRPGAGRAIGGWLDVIGAQNTQDAMRAVRRAPHPSLVWIFADAEGHIGKQASGWLPVRGGASGLAPAAAWDEENHWRGVVPEEKLPSEYDPPRGFVASANEELYMADGTPLHSHGLHDYRRRRADELLTEYKQATVEQMQSMQYDVVSPHARDLLPVLLAHLEDGPLKERMSNWDHRFTPESEDAALFINFYRSVMLEVFGQERGIGWRRMMYLATRMGYSAMVLTAIDRTLPKVTSAWWRQRKKGDLIRAAAQNAIEMPPQKWSDLNAFHFTDRFFGDTTTGRLLGFRSRRTPMPGCHATLFQGHLKATASRESTFAPSYHLVTDLSTDEAWTNLPGGPSESRFSKWYDSDIKRWREGRYKRLAPDG